MINWKVRIKNKTFWLSLIPALLLLAQALGAVFGLSLGPLRGGRKALTVVNTLFARADHPGRRHGPDHGGRFRQQARPEL